ncbi:MAG: glycosyltransferase family 39 protein [Anaerolineae bacterium]|nr:glycosyltransferase family 39 protein [Anaerolineae bacterium]
MTLGIVLIAFGLRIYLLDNQSFAFDEGWTSYAIHHPWREMWAVLAPDNHPPLYYLLVKALAELAGYGDFATRFLSVFCGTVVVAGVYALGRRLGGQVGGLAAALFASFSPSLIYYAQEARMYGLLMALGVLSSYCLTRLAEWPDRWRWWVGYVLAAAGALYTQYFAILLVVAHNVAALGWIALQSRRERRWVRLLGHWALAQAAILALYLPWLPTAIRQVSIGQGTWWRIPLPASMILSDIWLFFTLGPNRPSQTPWLDGQTAGVLLALVAALLLGWRNKRAAGSAFAWALLALPVALVVWTGSRWPVYTDRYTLIAAPGLTLLVGLGVAGCWKALSGRWRWLGALAGASILLAAIAGQLGQLNAYYHQPAYWREDFCRATQYVMDTSGADDAVLMLGAYQPMMQYYRGAAQVARFPLHGDSVQDEAEVVDALNTAISPASQVRLVMYSWPTVDPQGLVEGMLRTNCRLQGEHWQRETGQRPIKLLNFEACAPFAVEPRSEINARWGDQVALTAYRQVHFEPGTQAHLFLWWQTLRHPDENYNTFVHLLDADGQMITQFDHLPLSDFYPMQAWPSGTPQRDDAPLNIPADVDLDGAWLAVGVYDRASMQRLLVTLDGEPVGGFLRIPVGNSIPLGNEGQ